MHTSMSGIAGLFIVLMNLYLHGWITGSDSSRYKFSMIEIKSDISGFEVKWGCSSRSDDPVESVHNGNSSLNVIKGLEISDFKNKQGCTLS